MFVYSSEQCYTNIIIDTRVQPVPNADFIIPVEIDNQVHQVYVLKRPGVDQFLKSMAEKFEVVVFTASLAKVFINASSSFPLYVLTVITTVCGPRAGSVR